MHSTEKKRYERRFAAFFPGLSGNLKERYPGEISNGALFLTTRMGEAVSITGQTGDGSGVSPSEWTEKGASIVSQIWIFARRGEGKGTSRVQVGSK